jgi:RimJ/RimL family protein N-acetyltransferase
VEFDLQPQLTGDLIEIRPLTPGDFGALYEAAKDPLIWEQHPESNRHEEPVFRKFFDGSIASKGAFAVIDRATGRVIGTSRYCNLDPTEREVEIGWTFLERAFWGGAYNRELKSLMINHAFRFVDRVVFQIGENNIRSKRAIQKIGATFLRRAKLPMRDGDMTPHLVFGITRSGTPPRLFPGAARPFPCIWPRGRSRRSSGE